MTHQRARVTGCVLAAVLAAMVQRGMAQGPGTVRTDADLRSPAWWLGQAVHQAMQVSDPGARAQSLLYAGHRLADRGELEAARDVAGKIEELLKGNAGMTLENEPQWLLVEARVQNLGE